MNHDFIETDNYIKYLGVLKELQNLPSHSHKMALFYGKFGIGKTLSLERLASYQNAALVRTLGTWTIKTMLVDICTAIGIDETGSAFVLQKRIIDSLIDEDELFPDIPKIIIIDEVDTIQTSKNKNLLLTLRDIHDVSKIPIIFTGMEQSVKHFVKDAHYKSRFVRMIKILPNSKNDISKYCKSSKIKIDEDLVEYFYNKYANLRQIKTLIIRLEAYCDLQEFESANVELLKASEVEK